MSRMCHCNVWAGLGLFVGATYCWILKFLHIQDQCLNVTINDPLCHNWIVIVLHQIWHNLEMTSKSTVPIASWTNEIEPWLWSCGGMALITLSPLPPVAFELTSTYGAPFASRLYLKILRNCFGVLFQGYITLSLKAHSHQRPIPRITFAFLTLASVCWRGSSTFPRGGANPYERDGNLLFDRFSPKTAWK